LEERAGERRPFTLFDAEICAAVPAGCRTSSSEGLAENDDILSLALSSKGGEGNRDVCELKPTSPTHWLRLIINR
jgi:hypothetical protein